MRIAYTCTYRGKTMAETQNDVSETALSVATCHGFLLGCAAFDANGVERGGITIRLHAIDDKATPIRRIPHDPAQSMPSPRYTGLTSKKDIGEAFDHGCTMIGRALTQPKPEPKKAKAKTTEGAKDEQSMASDEGHGSRRANRGSAKPTRGRRRKATPKQG